MLQAELSDARLALAQMEQQAVTVQSLQSRLSELECEQHSSVEWAEGALNEKRRPGYSQAAAFLCY